VEINSLKRLREIPYVVKLYDVYKSHDRTHLVMEEMKGGDLLDKLYEKERFTEAESKMIARRLLEAIYFCHKKKVAHRDVKPENILIADCRDVTRIKLADFGCAHLITGEKCLHTLCGSPQYVAPELYTHVDGYDEKCDIWSAGIVIFVILGGYAPFEAPTMELPALICEGYVSFDDSEWHDISDQPKALIRQILVVNPDERVSLKGALDSDWLKRRDKESVQKYSKNLDGSSSRPFDAWIKLQNDSVHSQRSLYSDASLHSKSTHSIHDALADSTRSFGVGEIL
jgi:serine/threonine protein kinase